MLRILKHTTFVVVLAVAAGFGAHYALYYGTRHGAKCEVPQFKYESLDRAREVAIPDELRIVINDSLYAPMYAPGVVLDQLPVAGTVVKPGRAIYVTINAMQRRIVDMPYVAGRSLRQARNMLELAGFEIGELIYEPDLASNYVLRQVCNGEQVTSQSKIKAPVGSPVELYIGLGNMSETVVPDLMGQTIVRAKSQILEAGLNLDSLSYNEDIPIDSIKYAMVMRQSVDEESVQPLGTKLSIRVTLRDYMVDSMRRERVRERIRREEEAMELQRMQDSIDMGQIDTMDIYKQIYDEFGSEHDRDSLNSFLLEQDSLVVNDE